MALVDPATYPKDRRRIDRLWNNFEIGRIAPERLDPYETTLVRNWMRCRSLGVNPAMREGLILSEQEYQAALTNSRFILEKASPILERVSRLLRSVQGILMLTDHQGTILCVNGDPSTRLRAAEDSGLVEGGCWLESVRGTNGIGTAITQKEAVHIYANEHFCESWQKWSCAATPILAPYNDEILGVINFTTFEKDYKEDALALTYTLSGQIMAELRLQLETERLLLLQDFSACENRYPSEGFVLLDRSGNIVKNSPGIDPGSCDLQQGKDGDKAQPKQARTICLPGTDTKIGSLLVFGGKSPAVISLPSAVPEVVGVAAFGAFATANGELKQIMRRVSKVMTSEINVLLIGETGTGKEIIANYIHTNSKRRSGPFVAVNCGAISKELFESKLFGYERGAFTGADPKGRKGLFEAANGGTLFLDEVGEMPLDIQASLLRVLESGRFTLVGSNKEISTDCRIIAATNRTLSEEIERGTFRSDLYFRLGVAEFHIPPLRERPEDVPVLIERTMESLCRKHGVNPSAISEEAMELLTGYGWPGNGREVRNVMESAMICGGETIAVEDLPVSVRQSARPSRDLRPTKTPAPAAACENNFVDDSPGGDYRISANFMQREAQLIEATLKKYKDIPLTCQALGVSRTTFYRKCKAHGLTPGDYI